jgi:hypothetical protein
VIADLGADVQWPATLHHPPRLGSWGDEIVDWNRSMGVPIDAEQALCIDAHASYGPGGRWVALEAVQIEPRQNGKTAGVMLPLALADLWLFPARNADPDKVIWTAHLMKTALGTWKQIKTLIEANPEMSRRVKTLRESKTDQGIDFMNGWTFDLAARAGGGGRGLTKCKRIVFDEALYLEVTSIGDFVPTMRTHPNPQIGYASSAGKARSSQLRSLMKRGRARADETLSYAEYKADGSWSQPGCPAGRKCTHLKGVPGCRLGDEDQWRKANHAMRRGRIGLPFLRAEQNALRETPEGVLESGRENLGWEESGDDPATKPINPDDWAGLTATAEVAPGERPVFFLDVSPESRSASVGVASMVEGGRRHVDLTGYRGGADWLVARAVELNKDHPGAVFAATDEGGASQFRPALAAAGLEVEWWTQREMARACVHTARLVHEEGFTHDGDPNVAKAVDAAVKRDIGDGLWVLTRKGPTAGDDLSPLYANIGALWLLEKQQGTEYDVTESVY